jgi:HPt (histidine-containing phosphotransfer) domain-containing protein
LNTKNAGVEQRLLTSSDELTTTQYQRISPSELTKLSESMGDEFDALLQEYHKGAEAMIEELLQALQDKRYQDAIRLAHGLKSSSSYFGASSLQALCLALEEGLKKQPILDEHIALAAGLFGTLSETMLEIEQHMRLYSK